MHRIRSGGKVHKVDHDDIINLCSQYWPQEAEPVGMQSLFAVGTICKLSVHRLLINSADIFGVSFQENRCISIEKIERR